MVGMRKRSLSVFASKGDNRLSRKFEGVASDNDGHSDSENEEDDIAMASTKSTLEDEGLAESWTKAEYVELVEQLKQSLPTKDIRKYTTSLRLVKWDKIHVKQHGPEEVKRVTHLLISKIRGFRTLGEMLDDIPDVVQKIMWADKPKAPLSAYNLFLKENMPIWREQHKEMLSKDVFKFGSKAFAELPEKKKRKYEDTAARLKCEYKETLSKFYEEHPDMVPQKNPKSRIGRVRNPAKERTKTPFNLFYESRQDISANISQQQARKEWDMLTMKKKLPFIKASFEAQTGAKLNKKEQEMLDRYHGKPDFIGRNAFDYFMRTRGANTDATTNLSGTERMKKLREEYHKLSDRERLELKVDYYKARDSYISKYQAYIENLPEQKRQVEIEYLQSLTDKGSSKGKKPSTTAETTTKDEELYPGSAEEDPPVAESTTIKKPAKDKKTSRKKELPVEEEHEEEDEEHLDSSPSKKSKMIDDSSAKKLIPKMEYIKTEKKNSNKKNKPDYSGDETRSNISSASKSGSILKSEPKKRVSPGGHQQQVESTKAKKSKQETPVAMPKEPEKPPKLLLKLVNTSSGMWSESPR